MVEDIIQLSLKQAEKVISENIGGFCKADNISFAPPLLRGSAGKSSKYQVEMAASKIEEAANCLEPTEDDIIKMFDLLNEFIKAVGVRYPLMEQLTDDDKLMEIKEITAYVIGAAADFSLRWAKHFVEAKNDYRSMKLDMEDRKSRLYKEMTSDEEKFRKYNAQQNTLKQELDAIRKDVDECISEVFYAREKLKDIEHRKKAANKWRWVPFYNIVLYLDSNDAESRYEVIKHKLEIAEQRKNELLKKSCEVNLEFLCTDIEQGYLKLLMIINNQNMNEYNVEIDLYTAKILMCSDFALFLGSVYSSLSYAGCDALLLRGHISHIEEMLTELKTAKKRNEVKINELERTLKNMFSVKLIGPLSAAEYTHFADIKSITDNNLRISGIIIRSGDIVDSIQLLYEDGSKGMAFGNDTGGDIHFVEFEKNDSLESVSGMYGVGYWDKYALSAVCIRTQKGRIYGPFGTLVKGGRPFELKVPENMVLRGIFGSACVGRIKGNVSDIGLVVE